MTQAVASTTERILEASLQLFNVNGFQNVPALHIAMRLGISPGHLAYHFKSKDEIVMALFPEIENALNRDIWDTVKPEQPMSPEDAALQQIKVFHSLWHYRFVFNALTKLMSEDGPLRARYLRLQDNIIAAIYGLFDDLIAHGDMRAIPAPNSTRLIARSIWMIYLSWLRFEQIETPDRDAPRNASIRQGIMQNFSVWQPYVSPEFAEAMLLQTQKALPDETEVRADPKAVVTRTPKLRRQAASPPGSSGDRIVSGLATPSRSGQSPTASRSAPIARNIAGVITTIQTKNVPNGR